MFWAKATGTTMATRVKTFILGSVRKSEVVEHGVGVEQNGARRA